MIVCVDEEYGNAEECLAPVLDCLAIILIMSVAEQLVGNNGGLKYKMWSQERNYNVLQMGNFQNVDILNVAKSKM